MRAPAGSHHHATASLVACELVGYDVRTERVQARPLAAIGAQVARERLGADIIRLLDMVWPVLRAQGARTGHNVVIYHGARDGVLSITVGVEAPDGFESSGAVQPAATPAGEVATTAHFGEYSRLAAAYEALEQWCAANDRRPAGVNWEVYGDWDENPANRRTDIYFLLG
jgi:effector-binding domain-containing protein